MGTGFWRGSRQALAMGFLALVLSACGGGDGGEPSETLAPKADTSAFKGNGIWGPPTEPGSGFFVEAQGGTAVVTFYLYETSGKPVWYTAVGPFTAGASTGKYEFSGTLLRYSGGQADKSTTPKAPTSVAVGTTTISFDREDAQVQLPGRSFAARKFFERGRSALATASMPETGIYWNPAESGRGFAIEVSNTTAVIAMFHYGDDGQPTWHLVNASVYAGAGPTSWDFMGYTGGQTLSGKYNYPTSRADGTVTAIFNQPCTGKFGLPGMAAITLQRFAFGSLAPGAECRASSVPAPVVNYFNDVTLSVTPGSLDLNSVFGRTVAGTFNFSATGNVASLNGKTIYVVVEDPDSLYVNPPRVNLHGAGATLFLTSRQLEPRKYGDFLKIYVCLDTACGTQFKGSPFVIPYYFTIK